MLGVAGLMSAYLAGNVTLANAVGTGISDDKAVYSYMPDLVRFYTGDEPILQNVPTWRCREPEALSYVLDHLDELVVKEVGGSGGYGMLIGPTSSKAEIETFRAKLQHAPEQFIAQPTLALSTCPTFVDQGVAPRHVDLRPFVLTGSDEVRITPGGLSRVALKEGSLVGGGATNVLSRTADNLYWTARYVERADFLARVIDSALRLSALPASWSGASTEWESAIATSGAAPGFYALYGDANEQSVCDYL
eukprot:gene21563-26044_t